MLVKVINTHTHTPKNLRERPCGWFVIAYSKAHMGKEQDCDISVLIDAHTN